jgi:hypothetical protein
MPLRPPKISHALTWDQTQVSAYRVVNTLEFNYKNNSFNAVQENNLTWPWE